MELNLVEKRKLIIEKIRKRKKVTIEVAEQILASLETYCELVIQHTLKKSHEQN
jgi:hypothetical protein